MKKNRDSEKKIKQAQTIDAEIKKIKEKSDIGLLKVKAEQYDEKIKRL